MKTTIFSRYVMALAGVMFAGHAFADPVQFDTDSAHVIVIRPIDLWSGSQQSNDFIFDTYKNKQARYFYFDDQGNKVWGEDTLFHSMNKDSVEHDVAVALQQIGFSNSGMRGGIFTVNKAAVIDASEMPMLIQRQDAVYKQTVIKNGDPSLIAAKIRHGQWVSMAVGLATAGVAANKFGTTGLGSGVIVSGAGQQTYQLSMEARRSVVAVPSVPFDYSQYKTVDIRTVVNGPDRIGEIIIAYKGDKTPEAEREALAKAIVTASGADSTLEAIQAAQAKDLAARQAIWDEFELSGQRKGI